MSAKFTLEGDAGGAVKALDAVNKALDATKKGAEGAVVSTKQLQAIAMRIREAEDPMQKYNRKLAEMKQALDAGLISQKQFESGSKKLAEQLEKVGDASGKAFSMQSISSVGKMGLEIMGISSALSMAIQGMKEFDQERRKAADDALRSRMGVGQLSQLAASDKNPQKAFANLVAEADAALRIGAASDRGEAAGLVFDLSAAGLEKPDREFDARMRASGTLQNVGGLGAAYDALKTAMGEQEIGSFREFASKSLAAGAVAPGTVEQLPVALARASSSAKALGITDEYLLAAGAVLSKEAGSASEGGTKLAALLAGIQKSGVDTSGMTGSQMIERLSKENTNFGGVFKDNDQAISAFRTLRANMVQVADLEGNISTAQRQGLSDIAVGLPNQDPSQFAANLRAAREGSLSSTNEKTLSRGENLRQAALADWSDWKRRRSPGIHTEIDIATERWAQEIPIFGDPNRALEQTQNGNMPVSDPALNSEIRDYLKEIAGNTSDQKQQTRSKISTRPE